MPLDRLDDTVGKSFPAALDRLEKAGARLSAEKLPLHRRDDRGPRARAACCCRKPLPSTATGSPAAAADIDPNLRIRLERASQFAAADYIDMAHARAALVRAMDARLADLDVVAMPTTPIVAPLMSEVAEPDDFARRNALLLRNTTIWNFFDCCAISLPLPRAGGLPTGLMLAARNGHDHHLFRIAAAVERLLAG